ncbi:hypothetical protein BO82DRAFT_357868, partial [Aspergillus uvarum CBS 121591]
MGALHATLINVTYASLTQSSITTVLSGSTRSKKQIPWLRASRHHTFSAFFWFVFPRANVSKASISVGPMALFVAAETPRLYSTARASDRIEWMGVI